MDKIRIVMGSDAKKGDVCQQEEGGFFYQMGSGIYCVFCGYHNCKISVKNPDTAPFYVMCPECGAKGPQSDSTDKAVNLWNAAGDK